MNKKQKLVTFLRTEYDLVVEHKQGVIVCSDKQGNEIIHLYRRSGAYSIVEYSMIEDILQTHSYDITEYHKRFVERKPRARTIKITEDLINGLAKEYMKNSSNAATIGRICDETLDRSGQLLGEVRKVVRKELYNIE